MIEFRSVSVGAGNKNILRDISFTCADGSTTVILGKNGSGKTTLLRAASGAVKYGGSIMIDGAEASEIPASSRSRLVSIMPQVLPQPKVTVRELARFGRQPYTGLSGRLSPKDIKEADAAIEKAGMAKLSGRAVNTLSGGERQRAYFALLLAQDTKNVMLDEPSAHLDAGGSRAIGNFIGLLAKRGKTLISVMHDINSACEIADNIAVISEGELVFFGGTQSFCEERIPERFFDMTKYVCQSGEQHRIIYR